MDETDRSRAHSVTHERRQPRTNVVQLFQQRQRAPEHPAATRNPRRCHQHQPPHPIRLLHCQLGRHQPTQRVRENVHAPEPDRIQQTPQPGRHLPRTQPSQPRQLHQMKPPALREPLHQRQPPTPRPRQPVHNQHVLAHPHHPAAHPLLIDLNLSQLHDDQSAATKPQLPFARLRPARPLSRCLDCPRFRPHLSPSTLKGRPTELPRKPRICRALHFEWLLRGWAVLGSNQ